jgi:ferrous iron transport protein B
MVTVDVLLGRQSDVAAPDAVLCIIDASNLERNLYLASQVLALGLPTVVALNMVDLAAAQGATIDAARLERQLGVSVVEIQANRGKGLDTLRTKLAAAVHGAPRERHDPFPEAFRNEAVDLAGRLRDKAGELSPFLVERLLLDNSGYIADDLLASHDQASRAAIAESRQRLAAAGMPTPAVEAIARYGWVSKVLSGVVERPGTRPHTFSDKLDRVLCHRIVGTIIFAALMFLMFQAIFAWATTPMDWIEAGKGWIVERIVGAGDAAPLMDDGPLRSLITDGVIEGVGGVLVFLPQILILFAFIAVLEDCGYMARAAYLMDRLMAPLGLSGKSFIPLLSSFACAIPGVMAARVIENRRDRLLTILIAPLMSCSARLPVYNLLIGAFIPATLYAGGYVGLQGITLFAMYLVGVVAAVFMTLLFRRTIIRGETPPFVMELPSFKVPSLKIVAARVVGSGSAFVRRAGTIIFAVMVLVWAAAYYPRYAAAVHDPALVAEQAQLEARIAALRPSQPEDEEQQTAEYNAAAERRDEIANHLAGQQQRQSYLGQMGHAIEPVVRPLGWDWKIGCAAIASFPAREVIVGTLAVLYDLNKDEADKDESVPLREKLQTARRDDTGELAFNVPVALSIMVFFALCAQCGATLAVIKRETNSWRWPAFTFGYMTLLAYVCALITYQVAIRVIT